MQYCVVCETGIVRSHAVARALKEITPSSKVIAVGYRNHHAYSKSIFKTFLKLIYGTRTINVNYKHLNLSDKIIVVKPWIKNKLIEEFNLNEDKIISLNIDDNFIYTYSSKLKKKVNEEISNHLEEILSKTF